MLPEPARTVLHSPGWSDTDGWQAVHVGSKWFGAWPRKYLHDEIVTANKWASTTETCIT